MLYKVMENTEIVLYNGIIEPIHLNMYACVFCMVEVLMNRCLLRE